MSKHKQHSSEKGAVYILGMGLAAGIISNLVIFFFLAKLVESRGMKLQAAVLPATLGAALGVAAAGYTMAKLNGKAGILCGGIAAAFVSVIYLIGVFWNGIPIFTYHTPLKLFTFAAAGLFGGYLGTIRPSGIKRHRRAG